MSADALFELGVPIADADEEPLAYAECIRLARRLRPPGYSPIGFIPATEEVAVAPVAIQLGAALADLTAQDSAYVDGLARIAPPSWSATPAEREPSAPLRWLRPALAVVTPQPACGARERAIAARHAVAEAVGRFRHVVVDLTGFDRIGEMESMVASLHRVVVVASTLATTEADLLAAVASVPPPKRLGVLLVGGR